MGLGKDDVVKSFGWKLLERFSVQGVSFIVAIVIARILLPEEYGVIVLVNVFLNLANVIVDGGLNTALVQKKDVDNTDFSTIFYVSMIVSACLYIILYFSATFISDFYGNPELVPIIRALGVLLFFYAVNSVQRAYISRNMLFRKLFVISLAAVIISGVTGIVLAIAGYGVWALVWQNLTSSFVLVAVTMITVKWRPTIAFSTDSFYALFSFGWKIFLTNMMIACFQNVRNLLIGKFYNKSMLAFFDRGKQLPDLLMQNINTSLQTVLFPVLSANQENHDHIRSMVRRTIKSSCLFVFPMMTLLTVTACPLISLLLTDKWLPAVPYVQIFAISYILMPMQIANIEAIKSMGYSNVTLRLEIIKKIPDIIILTVSVLISVEAIAWGAVLYNFICIWINMYPNRRLLNYTFAQQFRDFLPILAVTIVAGLAAYMVLLLDIAPFMTILLQTIICGFVYISLCHMFRIEAYQYVVNALLSYRSRK